MAPNKVKDGNFYVIQSFMVKDLKLKGLEKDVYAIIYGFSQAEGQVFNGSLQYLCDWTFSSRQGVMNALKKLVEKGLIEKKEVFINNVKFVEYSANEFIPSQQSLLGEVNKIDEVVKKIDGGSQESSLGGSQDTLHNNISLNNTFNNIDNNIFDNKDKLDKEIDKIDKEDKPQAAKISIVNKNELNIEVHSLTAHLIDREFIKANDTILYKYNDLFERVLKDYEYTLVCKVINYVIARVNEKLKYNDPIDDKFNYFKASLLMNLHQQTTEYKAEVPYYNWQ